ncbi:MAG: hypothetical protein WC392_06340 [Sulfuricella sp.]|jgi:hypothetical protein
MWEIEEHRRADKQLSGAVPIEVLKRYEKWKDIARVSWPPGLRAIKGFHDEALSGGLPLLIVQLSAIFFSSPIGFVFVLLLWLPVLVSLYWLIKRLTSRAKGRAESGASLS